MHTLQDTPHTQNVNRSLVNEGLRDGQKLSIEINIPENGRFIDAFKNCWMSKSSTNIEDLFLTTRKYGFSCIECIIFGQTLKNNNMSLIKKSSKQVLLFFSMTLSILGISQEAHLDVEGLAKIRGRVDLNLTEDTSVVVIGRSAGINMTFSSSSRKNTFVGSSSGRANTSGYDNSFFGTSAGLSNTSAYRNSFFGANAGLSNTTGIGNSFFGYRAGESNVSGSSNVFFGYETGRNNTTGIGNSFFGGFRTGENNTTGIGNSFFGNVSGQSNTTGGGNSFYGVFSGESNISGSNNVCLGHSSGRGDSTMRNSTYIGYEAGAGYFGSDQVERAGNVFLGHQSGKGEIHSNRLYIENSDVDSSQALIYGRFDTDELSFNANVGINTTEPSAMLEVFGNSTGSLANVLLSSSDNDGFARLRFENDSGDDNYWDIGGQPKIDDDDSIARLNFSYNNTGNILQLFGDGKVGIGEDDPEGYVHIKQSNALASPHLKITGDGGDAFVRIEVNREGIDKSWFHSATTNASDASSFYSFAFEPTSGSFVFPMRMDGNGHTGFGKFPGTNRLEVEGNASKTVAGNWLANSDRRIKTDVNEINDSYDLLNQLHPVKFKYTEEWIERHPSIKDQYYYNFIAQEYQEVFPESVQGSREYLENDEEEILQIDTYNAQIVTISAVKELIKENEELRNLVKNLDQRLRALEHQGNQKSLLVLKN